MAPSLKVILAVAIVLFFFTSAKAGERYSSYTGKKDFCLTIRTQDGSVANTRCLPIEVTDADALTQEGNVFLLRAGLASGGATTMTTTDTEISTSYSLVDKEISSDPNFQSGTLPDGKDGQILTIRITSIDGEGTFTLTPDTATGFTSLVFEAVGDHATLLFVDSTVGWIRINVDSVQSVD